MGSSQPRDWTRVSCTAGRSFTIWVTMEAQSTPQSQMCKTSQTRSWSLFGGLLPIWSPGAFWVLAKPLHLRSMLSKSMRCIENSNACSRRDQQKGPSSSQQCPTARHTTNAPKVEQIGLWSFVSSTVFTWPVTSHHSFHHADNLLQAKRVHHQQEADTLSQRLSNPEAGFTLLGKQTYFSLAKVCRL